jgi:hypothetical protein
VAYRQLLNLLEGKEYSEHSKHLLPLLTKPNIPALMSALLKPLATQLGWSRNHLALIGGVSAMDDEGEREKRQHPSTQQAFATTLLFQGSRPHSHSQKGDDTAERPPKKVPLLTSIGTMVPLLASRILSCI